jgi:uncharacterized membrane protein
VTTRLSDHRWFDSFLAWYFVTIWGSGFLASKIGMLYAPPFSFLTLRFIFGILCMLPLVLITRPLWPASRPELGHVIVAGLLMHAMHLGGSHYTQYLGVSAGITAVLLTVQPLLTAFIASRWLGERLSPRQWAGIAVGFAGVVLVVWHKIDIREMTDIDTHSVHRLGRGAGTARLDRGRLQRPLGVAHVCGDCISGDMRLDTRRKRAPHIDASWRGDARDEPFLSDPDIRGSARVRTIQSRADGSERYRDCRDVRRRCISSLETRSACTRVACMTIHGSTQ